MLPPAPGRFSTTNGWPSVSVSFCAVARARMSVVPPAGNGTTTRTGLVRIGRLRVRVDRHRRARARASSAWIVRVMPFLRVSIRRRRQSAEGQRASQSTFAPDAFTILAYFASSRAMNCENCSGVFGDGSAPSATSFARTSAELRIFVTSAFHFATIGAGVPGGREQAVPRRDVEPGQARFRHRGQVGDEVRALRGGHRKRLDLARLHLRHRVGEVVEHELRVAREQRLRRRRAALERHVHGVGAGLDLEQLAREVPGAAVAARAEGELAGIRLGVRDELLGAVRPATMRSPRGRSA